MKNRTTKASERIGVESTSRDGKRAQVVNYTTCENFIVRFYDGREIKLKNWKQFIEGNFNYEKYFKTLKNSEERIGKKKIMNNGLVAVVVAYRGSHDIDILFEDGEKRTGVSWRDFCAGNIAHPTILKESIRFRAEKKSSSANTQNCSECDSFQLYQDADTLPGCIWKKYFLHLVKMLKIKGGSLFLCDIFQCFQACISKKVYAKQTFLRRPV